MVVTEQTKKIIISRSGGICYFPGCGQELAPTSKGKQAFVAQIAHIKGENPGSARYDSSMLDEDRNNPNNLMAMCPTHHKIIDDKPDEYTSEKLFEIKKNHEEWIRAQTIGRIVHITFSELDVIAKHIVSNVAEVTDISAIHPKEKIKKNELSERVENLIIRGLAQVELVKEYVDKNPDSEFGERLKQGFIERYNKLKNEGLSGDDLFDSLFENICQKCGDFGFRAAALTVLSYYFEKCDIFEK
jgi:hypothetical protein